MKSQIIALALFAATAAAVVFYPAERSTGTSGAPPAILPLPPVAVLPNERGKIEVVFVLDTTGSMSGLIQAAKEKIWSIATTMASAQTAPEIRMGLVAYRDRGDTYVTQVVDLSTDLDSMYATLMDFQADGGGDEPESVNQALYEAVHDISWSQDRDTYKVIFLVGDAPPHMDYQDDIKYPQTLAAAVDKGIVVNTVQCGQFAATTAQWTRIAQLAQGRYFQVEQAGSAVAVATPYDGELARLSMALDETRLFYGTEEEKQALAAKRAATEKLHGAASESSRARRASFNVSASGKDNFLGERELVADVASGRVDLDEIDAAALPEPMQALSPEERRQLIEANAGKRTELESQIRSLADKRGAYIKEKVEEAGGAEDSLDHQLYSTVREQAAAKGLRYEDGPEY